MATNLCPYSFRLPTEVLFVMGVSYCERFRRQFVSLSKKNAYNVSNAKVATICLALVPSMLVVPL